MSVETRFATYLEQNADALAEQLTELFRSIPDAPYVNITPEELRVGLREPFLKVAASLRGQDDVFLNYSREAIRRRAQQDTAMAAKVVGSIGSLLYQTISKSIPDIFPDSPEEQLLAKTALAELTFRSNQAGYEAYMEVRQEQLDKREAEIQAMRADYEQMSEAVRELSAPIAPIHDNVLVLPLVGTIDTNRAQTITEDLLEEIVRRQSDLVIIDITGVPIVDTNIANYLLQTTSAVNLLGAHVILVGISAEVAQTIVGLNLDLRQLTVRANLQDGIEYALEQLGLGIRPLGELDV